MTGRFTQLIASPAVINFMAHKRKSRGGRQPKVDLVLTSELACAACDGAVTANCYYHGEVEVVQLVALGNKAIHGELCGEPIDFRCAICGDTEVIG